MFEDCAGGSSGERKAGKQTKAITDEATAVTEAEILHTKALLLIQKGCIRTSVGAPHNLDILYIYTQLCRRTQNANKKMQ